MWALHVTIIWDLCISKKVYVWAWHTKRTGQTKFSMRYIKEETANDLRSKLHKRNEQTKYNYVATYMVEDVAKTFRHEANIGSFTPYQ